MRTLSIASVAVIGSSILASPVAGRQQLDATFLADRVLVDLPSKDGGKLRFYTDTGGGITLLYPAAVERMKLATTAVTGPVANGLPPSFRQLAGPLPVVGPLRPIGPAYLGPDFIAAIGGTAEADGFLGSGWFAGRVWTWDYPAKSLTLEDNGWQPQPKASVVPITFRNAEAGKPAPMFPRIVVSLAGEPTSMLLDTGAETLLTSDALKAIGGGPALRATSMIVASRFAVWRAAHPDWAVIENAQVRTGARMIRVPDVMIAGLQVGPVWFTERPDANFHGMMSAVMDARVEGAIGGNAFATLRMTVDYRAGRAAFERP